MYSAIKIFDDILAIKSFFLKTQSKKKVYWNFILVCFYFDETHYIAWAGLKLLIIKGIFLLQL